MSSDSESIELSDSTESMDCGRSDSSEEEWGVITSVIAPYQDEPLADQNDEETGVSTKKKPMLMDLLRQLWRLDTRELWT